MDEVLPESENWCLSITARNVNELENRKDILLAHDSIEKIETRR